MPPSIRRARCTLLPPVYYPLPSSATFLVVTIILFSPFPRPVCLAPLTADDFNFPSSDDSGDDALRSVGLDAPTADNFSDPYDADDSRAMDIDLYDVGPDPAPPHHVPLPPDDDSDYFDRLLHLSPSGSYDHEFSSAFMPPLHSSPAAADEGASDDGPSTDELEFQAASSLPPGPRREEAFRRLADRVGHVGTTWPWQPQPLPPDVPDIPPYNNGASTASQTFISVPPIVSPRLESVLAAGLHQHHSTIGWYPDGTYTSRDHELHSRDRDTTRLPLTYGPVPSPPWPPFMVQLRSATQTPRSWTHRAPPSAQGYLRIPFITGRHDTHLGRTWISLPAPIFPYIPNAPDRHGVRAASAPYATGTWIPSSWPRSHPSHVWPWYPSIGPLPPPGREVGASPPPPPPSSLPLLPPDQFPPSHLRSR